MKTTIQINGKPVEIELTQEQIDQAMKDQPFDFRNITSLEAALLFNGKTKEQFENETERDTDGQKATKELEEIALAIREGKHLSMKHRWYYPYFERNSVGGFSCDGYYCDCAYSYVGARLSVDSSEKAIFMGKTFEAIYNRHLAPSK